MGSAHVGVVASGPWVDDPYDPASPAWAVARGFAARGDEVRVLYPASAGPPASPDGVQALAVESPLRHPGTALGSAEFAHSAARRLPLDTDLVVRSPFGLGRILSGRRYEGIPVVGVVREIESAAYDESGSAAAPVGWLGRVDRWRDRRTVRKLEREALSEAVRIVVDSPAVSERLSREFGVAPARLRASPVPVLGDDTPPARAAAREALHLPLDVPVVVTAAAGPADPSVDRARDAFRRVRSIFAGLRLVVAGTSVPSDPGVVSSPDRTHAAFGRAFTAADVAVVAPSAPAFDPGAVLAMRHGCPVLAGPGLRLPPGGEAAVQAVASDDPADLAAALAELVADPARRRALAAAGRTFSEQFDPGRVAADLAEGLRRGD